MTYCTIGQVISALGQLTYSELGFEDQTSFDKEIMKAILEAQGMIDNHTRSAFASTTGVDVFDGNGGERYFPKKAPIISVSKLEDRGVKTDDWTEISSDDYYVQEIFIRYPFGFEVGVQNYQLTYTYGYATVPGDVEFVTKEVASRIMKREHQRKQGAFAPSEGFTPNLEEDVTKDPFDEALKAKLKGYVMPIIGFMS